MFEKVNPSHPDKIADRIAGALVDYAYAEAAKVQDEPRIAVEVLIGHGHCNIISETSIRIPKEFVIETVQRIAVPPNMKYNYAIHYNEYPQDIELEKNQQYGFRCGDNGIFKGVEVTQEEKKLTDIVNWFYEKYPTDGKFILNNNILTICQSQLLPFEEEDIKEKFSNYITIINPLGFWTGGPNVDSGATNRKLGSDMGGSITGGGLHGKDLSKADVSINIYCWLEAQRYHKPVEYSCSIGDDEVGYLAYDKIVDIAREYIHNIGGFEKFAEWGLIRP